MQVTWSHCTLEIHANHSRRAPTFSQPSLDVNESQNMEVFVIKERYHCYHTKRVQKIKAQVIKHIYKKRKILPRVLK